MDLPVSFLCFADPRLVDLLRDVAFDLVEEGASQRFAIHNLSLVVPVGTGIMRFSGLEILLLAGYDLPTKLGAKSSLDEQAACFVIREQVDNRFHTESVLGQELPFLH